MICGETRNSKTTWPILPEFCTLLLYIRFIRYSCRDILYSKEIFYKIKRDSFFVAESSILFFCMASGQREPTFVWHFLAAVQKKNLRPSAVLGDFVDFQFFQPHSKLYVRLKFCKKLSILEWVWGILKIP